MGWPEVANGGKIWAMLLAARTNSGGSSGTQYILVLLLYITMAWGGHTDGTRNMASWYECLVEWWKCCCVRQADEPLQTLASKVSYARVPNESDFEVIL